MEFSFLFSLYEGASGNPATADDCASYVDRIGNPSFPVFADGSSQIAGATPMTQTVHPEMCGLTPELEIISCYYGHGGHQNALADIKTHAGL